MAPRVSVVIPAYNEADRIASTVVAARAGAGGACGACGAGAACEVIVVDDCSSDCTAAEAERAGATVLRLGRRSGKGAALTEGVRRASGDVVVLLDADIGDGASEIRGLVRLVADGGADMAIARLGRKSASGGGLGIARSVAALGIRLCCGRTMAAPLSGQRAARREALLALAPFADGFGVEVGLTIDALRRGWRVVETDCAMTHRETRRDIAGFAHRARQLYWILKALARRVLSARERVPARGTAR